MQKASKQRFIGLEWLRFLLGCYVMIYHTVHQYPQRGSVPFLAELTSMGFFATSTFFVLSGFLLTHVYFNGNQMRESGRSFLKNASATSTRFILWRWRRRFWWSA